MSCHNIGEGLNTVSEKVLELYDGGKIEFDVANELLHKIKNGVHWCDGNEDEALACFDGCRCGKCLKKTDDLFEVYDTSIDNNAFFKLLDDKENGMITDGLCRDCFEKICKKHSLTYEHRK